MEFTIHLTATGVLGVYDYTMHLESYFTNHKENYTAHNSLLTILQNMKWEDKTAHNVENICHAEEMS